MTSGRRFPPPRTFDEMNDACFIVRDHNRAALAYFDDENEPGRRTAAELLRAKSSAITTGSARLCPF
jgi:hypothetical protein